MTYSTRALAIAGFCVAAGCGGSKSGSSSDMSAPSCSNPGGPVAGAADSHCGGQYLTFDPAQCTVDAGADDSGGGDDFGDTMYGSSGYDDDCKYFVSYTVDPVCVNEGVYFTATLQDAMTKKPITYSGTVRIEAFASPTHPANTAKTMSTSTAPGVYRIGPVAFDTSGMWTVRFHFFENCTDTPTSPHGHAAFFVQVP